MVMRFLVLCLCLLHGALQCEQCRLILIRHGQTAALAQNRYQENSALNALGREQAVAAAATLKNIAVDAMYTSPLLRAVQSAAPLAAEKKLVVKICDDLRERGHGSLEGRNVDPKAPDFHRYYHPQAKDDLKIKLVSDAESLEEASNRFVAALKAIASQHANQTVAVFTHGAVIAGLRIALTGRFDLPPIPYGGALYVAADKDALCVKENLTELLKE